MTKERGEKSNLFASEEEVVSFCRKHDLEYLGLFGSYARGEAKNNSDIDFLYKFRPSVRKTLFDVGGMLIELEQRFAKEIDLVQRNNIKPRLRSYIESEAVTLYEER